MMFYKTLSFNLCYNMIFGKKNIENYVLQFLDLQQLSQIFSPKYFLFLKQRDVSLIEWNFLLFYLQSGLTLYDSDLNQLHNNNLNQIKLLHNDMFSAMDMLYIAVLLLKNNCVQSICINEICLKREGRDCGELYYLDISHEFIKLLNKITGKFVVIEIDK